MLRPEVLLQPPLLPPHLLLRAQPAPQGQLQGVARPEPGGPGGGVQVQVQVQVGHSG